jgi:hypothetical protein
MRHAVPALLLAACAYEAPDNPFAPETLNVLSGSILVGDVDETGTTFVLLASAANPIPPYGLGRPVTFSAVRSTAYTDPRAGIRAATWSMTQVPDGSWMVFGLMDRDSNFHPGADTLAGATCGDIIGGHVASLPTGPIEPLGVEPAPIAVSGGEVVADVTLAVAIEMLHARPAFTVTGPTDLTPNGVFRLESVGVEAAYGPGLSLSIPGPLDTSAPDPCASAFWFTRRDADGDGDVDPHPDLPLIEDRWPRVFLQWLGEPVDADGDGLADAWDRGDIPADVLIGALGDPVPADGVLPDPNTPTPLTTLDVRFTGLGQRILPDGTREPILGGGFPPGAYAINVVSDSGQTWTLPNELDTTGVAARALPPPGVTSPRDPAQGLWMTLAP